MVGNDEHISLLSMAYIFERLLGLLIHGIHNATSFIINDEVLILAFIALLQKADNIDSSSEAGHEFRNNVALNNMPY